MKIVKHLEEYLLWHKGVSEKKKNVAKEKKGRVLCILAATLGANLLENTTGKDIVPGRGIITAGKN